MKRTTWFIFFVLLTVSCLDEPDCFNLNNNIAGIYFRVLGSSKADTVSFFNVVVPGRLSETGLDSMTVGSVPIELNLQEGQTSITFLRPTGTNTMTLAYQVQSQFVSEDCGSRFVLSNLSIVDHNFDSVRLVNSTPGSSNIPANIEVYRCPITNRVGIQFRELSTESRGSQAAAIDLVNVTDNYSGGSFYNGASLSDIYLSVDSTGGVAIDTSFSKSTTFTFNLADNTTKVLKLGYIVTPQQRYGRCGIQNFIRLNPDSLTDSFDSVSIVFDQTAERPKTTLTDPVDYNVYVFTCAETNLARVAFRTRVTGVTTRADTVSLLRVRAEHLTDPINYNANLSFVDLPLDISGNASTFYLDYQGGAIDTVALRYTKEARFLYTACGSQTVFSALAEVTDRTYVVIRSTSVKFPAVTNIEIVH